MNMVDFQEKMDPTHRMYLCRMLSIKETELLPEDLLERYAQVKKLIDRIDGHLTPGDLAMIIISVGDNPEIASELLEENELLDKSDDKVIEETIEQPDKYVGPDESDLPEQPTEQTVYGATGQAQEKPVESAKIWAPGMPVRALIDDELKQGKIVGISKPSDVGKEIGAAVQLTVELEGGETVTVEEDEVEAV